LAGSAESFPLRAKAFHCVIFVGSAREFCGECQRRLGRAAVIPAAESCGNCRDERFAESNVEIARNPYVEEVLHAAVLRPERRSPNPASIWSRSLERFRAGTRTGDPRTFVLLDLP
jgi:hypothetical protein